MKDKKKQSIVAKEGNADETLQRTNSLALSELLEEEDKQSLKNDMTDAYSEFTEEGKDINTKSQEIENLNSKSC